VHKLKTNDVKVSQALLVNAQVNGITARHIESGRRDFAAPWGLSTIALLCFDTFFLIARSEVRRRAGHDDSLLDFDVPFRK
jgi:hypothetical protein